MRRGLVIAGLLVAIVVVASILRSDDPRRDGPTGDPRATSPNGARAAVLLADELGRSVDVGPLTSTSDAIVVLHQELDDATIADLDEWVRSGGRLVSFGLEIDGLTPERVSTVTPASDGDCDLDGFSDIDPPSAGLVGGLDGGDVSGRSCYPVGDGFFLTVDTMGAGTVIATGSARPFLNSQLAQGHHAALLMAILELVPGELRFVPPDSSNVGDGDQTLRELVPEWMWVVLALGLGGGLVFMVSTSRRLGRPVPEGTAVEIDGSELLLAVSRLYGRAQGREHGVAAARAELLHDLTVRWSGDRRSTTDNSTVDEWIARLRITGDDADDLRIALTGPAGDDDAFLTTMRAITRARALVASGTSRTLISSTTEQR